VRFDSRAELERKDIELDQALQDEETLSKELEANVEASNEELKQERDRLGCYWVPILYRSLICVSR
jgi:hypothetical protein